MDANLDAFLDDLLTAKGITKLEGEMRQEVKEDMALRLLDQIDRSIYDEMTDEQVDELEKLLDDENFGEDQVSAFIEKCGLDIASITQDVLEKFREFYLQDNFSGELKEDDGVESGTGEVSSKAAEQPELAEAQMKPYQEVQALFRERAAMKPITASVGVTQQVQPQAQIQDQPQGEPREMDAELSVEPQAEYIPSEHGFTGPAFDGVNEKAENNLTQVENNNPGMNMGAMEA